MYEIDVMVFFLCMINGVLGFLYSKKFLKQHKRSWNLVVWVAGYMAIELLSARLFAEDVMILLVQMIGMLILQMLFFHQDMSWQVFVTLSFYAGNRIVKYIVSVMAFLLPELGANILFLLLKKENLSIEAVQKINDIFSAGILLLSEIVYIVIFIFYLTAIAKKFVKKDYALSFYENLFLIVPCFCALCISITLKKLIIVMESEGAVLVFERIPETTFWIPFICVLLLGTIISAVMLFQRLIWHTEEEKRNSILENQIEQIQQETKEIQSVYADMRGLRHDLKGHLNNITIYVRDRLGSENKEILHYVGKMEETVEALDFACKTGNPITDVIIRQKMQEAKENRIDFRADFLFPDKLCIDVYDIGIVLNNALQNAMEACKRTGENGVIILNSYVKGNLFFMEIENNFTGELTMDEENGLPVSQKKKKQLHGIGLENVRRCARKYNGDIDIVVSKEDGISHFVLTVMMCGKISHP